MSSDSPRLQGRKIVVIGCPGAGKSTLADTLSKLLSLPSLNLDSIAHRPNWQPTPPSELRDKIVAFLQQTNPSESSNAEASGYHEQGWIIDGNYRTQVRDLLWPNASDIIFLDLPIYIVLWRLFFRTIWRIWNGFELWGMKGCVETWQQQFFSRDSLFAWVVWFYRVRRGKFLDELVVNKPDDLKDVNVIWLRRPSDTERFLKEIEQGNKRT